MGRRLADQRIVREAPEELAVVVVDGEDEAQTIEPLVALRSQHEASIDELTRRRDFCPAVDAQARCEHAVADVAGGVVRMTDAKSERIRARRPDDAMHGKLSHGRSAS